MAVCSDFPSGALLLINEVEMVDSVEGGMEVIAINCGQEFPNFEMLDAKIASALNKIIQNSNMKKKVSLKEQKAQKEDRFLPAITLIYFPSIFVMMMFRNSMRDGMKIPLSMTKIPLDDILESLCKLRIRESDQLKTVLELYDKEIYQKISRLDYLKMKTMVRRSIDQKFWLRNFDARHEKIETGAVDKSQKGLSGVEKGKGICYQWKVKEQCSKGDQCSFRRESNDSAKPTPKAAPPSDPHSPKARSRSVSRKRNARGRSQ